MTEEKILYLAKESGTYVESTNELKRNDALFNLIYDMVHVKKYLIWKQKGDSKGWECHFYCITNLGLLRLALYRFSYANKKEPESKEKRLTDLKELVKIHRQDADNLKKFLSKENLKLLTKACQE